MQVRPIPLNLMTLFADLMQNVGTLAVPHGSLATKSIKNRKYVYVTTKDGSARVERYLGAADDPRVLEQAEQIKQASEQAKSLRNTVTLLKQARVPAPTLVQGRILEVIANAGLFKSGVPSSAPSHISLTRASLDRILLQLPTPQTTSTFLWLSSSRRRVRRISSQSSNVPTPRSNHFGKPMM